jgi:8-oxo-dGTP pyrophosphatase MutT (NUDIX family)
MQPPVPDPSEIKQHFAGAYLITNSGKVVGQHRDDKPGIDNPGKVGSFGGTIEPGETPLDAVWREIVEEETNLKLKKEEIVPLTDDISWRPLTGEWETRHFFYIKIKDEILGNLEVYEGQGWSYITGPDDPNIIESGRQVIALLFEKLKLS